MVLYARAGDAGDIWTATATSNLDMNNFSIVNVNTITILQTATTGQALDVSRNLAAASTDSAIVCFYNLNAGDDQPVLTVRTAANAAASNAMVIFESTDAAFDQPILQIIQDGTGQSILIQHNNDQQAVNITNTGIWQTLVSTRTNVGVAGTHIHLTEPAGNQNVLLITNAGTGKSIFIDHNNAAGNSIHIDAETTTDIVLYVEPDVLTLGAGLIVDTASNVFTGANYGGLVQFKVDHPDATGDVLLIRQDSSTADGITIDINGGGRGIYIDHDDTGTGTSISVIRDGNNAADIWGISVDVDNVGAGAPAGINMTSFAAGEALLGVPVDTTAEGAYYGRYAVYVNGVGIRYVSLHAA